MLVCNIAESRSNETDKQKRLLLLFVFFKLTVAHGFMLAFQGAASLEGPGPTEQNMLRTVCVVASLLGLGINDLSQQLACRAVLHRHLLRD